MGKQNSKLKPEVLEDLKQNTEFTGKATSIPYRYKHAMEATPHGFNLIGIRAVQIITTRRNAWVVVGIAYKGGTNFLIVLPCPQN